MSDDAILCHAQVFGVGALSQSASRPEHTIPDLELDDVPTRCLDLSGELVARYRLRLLPEDPGHQPGHLAHHDVAAGDAGRMDSDENLVRVWTRFWYVGEEEPVW